jgi:RNA polymerase sigma-70 factor (family 1)
MTNYSTLSDWDLQHLLKSGDPYAYTAIYDRYKWILHKHAYSKLKDREAASDVIQDLFTSIWQNRESLQIKSNLSGYLYQGVRNRVLNLIAHKQVENKYIDSLQTFIQKGDHIADHLVRERQLAVIIEKEISSLPAKMREVFELSRKLHMSHREIAIQLNVSEQTVKTQVRNALRILRVKLGLLSLICVLFCF